MPGIQLISQIYQGKLTGAAVDSYEISFSPGEYKHADYVSDTGTAGFVSCSLLFV